MNSKFYCRYEPSEFEINVLMNGMITYFKYPERSNNRNYILLQVSNFLKTKCPFWNQRNVRLYFNNNKNAPKFIELKKKYDSYHQNANSNIKSIIDDILHRTMNSKQKKCPQLYENYTNLEFVDEIGKGSLRIHCTQKHS